jgi:hypothetical protein
MRHLFLVTAVVVAACGGAQQNVPGPGPLPPSTAPTGSVPPPPPTTSATPPTSTTPGTAQNPPAPAFVGPMKSPTATQMATDLTGLGIDVKSAPELSKLEPQKLRKVMQLFTKALGVKCGDCHQEGDFAAPTPRKAIAENMWNQYVRQLAMADGSPLFCDSCHQGRMIILDRSDKKALGKWMDENFEHKLKRKDGKAHECSSPQCHGSDMDMRFIHEMWAKGKP